MVKLRSSVLEGGPRLISPLTLIIVGIVLTVLLALLLPTRELFTGAQANPDNVSLAYLQAVTNDDPKDQQVLITLARQQLKLGQVDEAAATLQRLGAEQRAAEATRWLRFDIAWARYTALEANDPARATRAASVRNDIHALAKRDDLSIEEQISLARRALALEQPAVAAQIFEKLATQDQDNASRWQAEAGQWWLAANQPLRAQQAWQKAYAGSSQGADRLQAGRNALTAARQADSPDTLNLARQLLQDFPAVPELRQQAISLALAEGNPAQALSWFEAGLDSDSNDEATLARHVELALAAGKPAVALQAGGRLMQLRPDDRELRERVAQLAEWSGNPGRAMDAWADMAQRFRSPQYDAQVIRLGKMLFDSNAVAAAMQRSSRKRPLSVAEMTLYAQTLEHLGEVERKRAVLQAWLQPLPEHQPLWEALADIHEQSGQLADAQAVWEQIETHYGSSLHSIMNRASLASRQWKTQAALDILLSWDGPANNPLYWEAQGDFAWTLNRPAVTSRAFSQLAAMRPLDAYRANILFAAAYRSGQFAKAHRMGRARYAKTGDSSILLQLLSAAMASEDAAGVEWVLQEGRKRPELISGNADFMQMVGVWHSRRGEFKQARQLLHAAIKLAPNKVELRSALLWMAIDDDRPEELEALLENWHHQALTASELWQPFAVAHRQLGNVDKALFWYDKAVRIADQDYLVLLDYAETLHQARRHASATKLRRYALLKVRPAVLARIHEPSNRDERSVAYQLLGAQQSLQGSAQNDGWFRAVFGRIAEHGEDAPALEFAQMNHLDAEFMVSWHLALQRPVAARYWLLRAHLRRLETPLWQRVIVAMVNNDRHALGQLLNEPGHIGIADRVLATRQIRHNGNSLLMSLNHIGSRGPYIPGVGTVWRNAAELYGQMPQNAGAKYHSTQLSNLSFTSSLLSFRRSRQFSTFGINARSTAVKDSGFGLDLSDLDREIALEGYYEHRQQRGRSQLKLGQVRSEDGSFLQYSASQSFQLTRRLGFEGFVRAGEQRFDSAAFRALGKRDSAGLQISYTPNARDNINFTASTHRYSSRHGERFGNGYSGDLVLSRKLHVGRTHEAQVRIQGGYQRNSLDEQLPQRIANRLPAGANAETLVAERYASAGVGIAFSRGNPGEDYPLVGTLRYHVDASVAWLWPSQELGVSVTAALGMPIMGSDDLSLRLKLDHDRVSNDLNRTLEMRYQHMFGR